jgi:hypothetical protein
MLEIKFIKYTFQFVCFIATCVLVGIWLDRYFLDEDVSSVETLTYFDTENDVFPVLSMCFEQTFEDELFKTFGKNIRGSQYKDFLLGKYYDEDLKNIDYNDVSTNITEFVLPYVVEYSNGSTVLIKSLRNSSGIALYYTYTWKYWGYIVKCFGLEITDRNIFRLAVHLKRNIFPGTIREPNGFAVLFHYPNQFLNSINTLTRDWKKRNRKDNYYITISVMGMNAIQHRYKSRHNNCFQNWKDYDESILEEHIESIGCKTPDTYTKHDWPICESKETMKKARYDPIAERIMPCREIESMHYQIAETEGPVSKFGFKDWFQVGVQILNPRYKLTIQKKEIDFQILVGYIGGYIGLFLGFALAQIPDTIIGALKIGRSVYVRIFQ